MRNARKRQRCTVRTCEETAHLSHDVLFVFVQLIFDLGEFFRSRQFDLFTQAGLSETSKFALYNIGRREQLVIICRIARDDSHQ